MAKKIERPVAQKAAVLIGRVAGTVEGAIEAVTHAERLPDHHPPEPVHPDVRVEEKDLNYRGVFIGGVCFIVGMWLFTGLLFFYFVYLQHYRASVSPPPLPITLHGDPLPPEPRLQGSPRHDLDTYLAHKTWELTHYYWLDKNKGRVVIPIEEAMRTLAQRGLGTQTGSPNPTATPPASGTRLTGFEGKVEPEPR
jgi:hypothetical protein